MEPINKVIFKERVHDREFEFHVPVPSTYGEAYDVALSMAAFFLEKNKEALEQLKASKPVEPEVVSQ